ncbi:peptidyl-prolyl cis-trans isomerase [Robertkochia aurantiaca]|uniref:peptidyl-prolyl cis-trans isomerase n=1 Tax=Robertkochia aurantiaca TaxID=2873700 RepID=UPI001CCE9D6B|nr:peptidyl-prolyl cis-trans isomerase [Robertkochia sp. 3YJGBD-33]
MMIPYVMRMRSFKFLICLLIVISFSSCSYFNQQEIKDPVARVGENYLVKEEIDKLLNGGISSGDSAVLVNNYINDWARKQLLLDRARINLSENKQQQFEELVAQYRADLYINAYKEALVARSMDTAIAQEELERFYEENKENFKLNEDLVKLRYLSVSPDFTNLQTVRERFRNFSPEDQEALREMALKFKFYSFNDSVWVRTSEVIQKIPVINTDNKDEYLKKSQFFELSDSLGVYLVAVNEVLSRNNTAPLSYVEPTVRKIILNKRKLEFLRTLEKELLDEATRNNDFQVYDPKK